MDPVQQVGEALDAIEPRRVEGSADYSTVAVPTPFAEAREPGIDASIPVVPDGEIVQSGPPEEAYRQPVNRFVAGIIGAPKMNSLPSGLVREYGPLSPPVGKSGAGIRLPSSGVPPSRHPLDNPRRIVEHRSLTAHGCRAPMSRSQLCARIAIGSSLLSRAYATAALTAVLATIADALTGGETVTVAGFGTFATRIRPAREGRNPRTGETIAIATSRALSFKASKDIARCRQPLPWATTRTGSVPGADRHAPWAMSERRRPSRRPSLTYLSR